MYPDRLGNLVGAGFYIDDPPATPPRSLWSRLRQRWENSLDQWTGRTSLRCFLGLHNWGEEWWDAPYSDFSTPTGAELCGRCEAVR